MTQTPRGIRNNNLGNIRWGADWQGLKKDGKLQDPSFCVFTSPEYGIRALAKLLRNYQRLYGLNTPRKIINRYAPPNENQTQAYIQSVAQQLGIQPDTPVDLNEEGVLIIFVKAIIRHVIASFRLLALALWRNGKMNGAKQRTNKAYSLMTQTLF